MRPEDIKKLQHLLADAYRLLYLSQQILAGPLESRDILFLRKNVRDAMELINEVEEALDTLRLAEEGKIKIVDMGPEDLV